MNPQFRNKNGIFDECRTECLLLINETATPFNDGVENLLKYAFNMDGTVTTLDLGNGLERVTITEPCDTTITPTSFSRVEVALPE